MFNKRALAIALVVAAFLVSLIVWGATQNDSPKPTPPSPGLSQSEQSAKLNQAYVTWVRNGRVADEATDQDLLAIGYAVCKLDEDPQYSDTIIVYNIEKMYTNAGQRILDGARQYIC
jgi:hypothetical protein